MSKTTRKQMQSRPCPVPNLASAIAEARNRTSVASNSSPRCATDSAKVTTDDAESMSQLGIYFDGRNYRYRGYRYGRLRDALAYARLMRSRHAKRASGVAPEPDSVVASQREHAAELMRQLSISFEAGAYRLGDFRYDNLADAVSYAQTCLRRHIAGEAEPGDPPPTGHEQS